jgi:hypothetical protein
LTSAPPLKKAKPETASTTRLFALVASQARVAVVFRRGPSKFVRMIRWDLATDEIRLGQWLAGRVYQEKCGISPDGRLVVYFAGKFGTELGTFTAVCRPPFFTALALWPEGSTYGGGGFFPSNKKVVLNYGMDIPELNGGKGIPRGFEVTNKREHLEQHRADVVAANRGWTLAEAGSPGENSTDPKMRWVFTKPWRFTKPNPLRPELTLERRDLGMYEPNGPAVICEYRLIEASRSARKRAPRAVELGRLDFAEWDHDGSLLAGEHGKLLRYRLPPSLGEGLRGRKLVGDFHDQKFENIRPTAEARRWP